MSNKMVKLFFRAFPFLRVFLISLIGLLSLITVIDKDMRVESLFVTLFLITSLVMLESTKKWIDKLLG